MKRTYIIIAIGILFLTNCTSEVEQEQYQRDTVIQENPAPASYAKVSLDWEGLYVGTLPCADCEGIETKLRINYDNSFELKERYIGKSNRDFTSEGTFRWNNAGNTVILDSFDQPRSYFVAENYLLHLDTEGNRIEGELAQYYVLTKE